MSKLERWLPFMFRRKNAEDKKKESESPSASSQNLAPATDIGPMVANWMQSMFNDPFFRDPFARFSELDRWFGDFSPQRFMPGIEVIDEDKHITVTAELPGMSHDDIELQIEGDALVLRGEKKNELEKTEKGIYRTERYYGYFHRAVPLPTDVDAERAEARFDKGVLTVRFPKLPGKGSARSIPIGKG